MKNHPALHSGFIGLRTVAALTLCALGAGFAFLSLAAPAQPMKNRLAAVWQSIVSRNEPVAPTRTFASKAPGGNARGDLTPAVASAPETFKPITSEAVAYGSSPMALRDLPLVQLVPQPPRVEREEHGPLREARPVPPNWVDPVAQTLQGLAAAPAPIITFEGLERGRLRLQLHSARHHRRGRPDAIRADGELLRRRRLQQDRHPHRRPDPVQLHVQCAARHQPVPDRERWRPHRGVRSTGQSLDSQPVHHHRRRERLSPVHRRLANGRRHRRLLRLRLPRRRQHPLPGLPALRYLAGRLLHVHPSVQPEQLCRLRRFRFRTRQDAARATGADGLFRCRSNQHRLRRTSPGRPRWLEPTARRRAQLLRGSGRFRRDRNGRRHAHLEVPCGLDQYRQLDLRAERPAEFRHPGGQLHPSQLCRPHRGPQLRPATRVRLTSWTRSAIA